MKTLKLKSLLFSLFAVALISAFLTSCEKSEVVDAVNQEVLSQKVINPEVAAAIENIDLLSKEELESLPTHLPTEAEIEEMTMNFRAKATSVDCYIGTISHNWPSCGVDITHSATWNTSGSCAPSYWTWYNVQKKRGNCNFTTEYSGLKQGNYTFFTPARLGSGIYLSAIFAWNGCQGKWTLEAEKTPFSICGGTDNCPTPI